MSGTSATAPSDSRVVYVVILSGKYCMGGGKRVTIASTKSIWELDGDGNSKDYAMEMKNLTMAGLHRHKEKVSQNKMRCELELFAKDGALLQTNLMWQYVWGYAENEIRKVITKNEGSSITGMIDSEGQKRKLSKWNGRRVLNSQANTKRVKPSKRL